jgi:nucleoside 2-deoxyribosyltransferase
LSVLRVIYIAGPFRGPDHWAIEQNIRQAEALALDVWKLGAAAVCPHLNTRHFQGTLPDQRWLDGDLAILRKCDAVLMTPDWKRSDGAKAEQAFAVSGGIPVFYALPEVAAWLTHPTPEVPHESVRWVGRWVCGFHDY